MLGLDFNAGNSRACIVWPLLYMAGIFWLSSISGQGRANNGLSPLVWISPNFQNLLHLPLYGGLAWLWLWSLRDWVSNAVCRTRSALIVTMGYGLLDEWHQSFVPGRYSSLTDVSFNFIGAIMGVLAYNAWISVNKRREPDEE